MSVGLEAENASAGVMRDLTFGDLWAALAAGWRDFRAFPAFGLFFASIFVVAGLLLAGELVVRGAALWLLPAAAGFPLLAPFVAVGLYEVSRRRENGSPMTWGVILGALRGRGDDQLILMGGCLFVGLTFWIILAHGIFAIFLSYSGIGSESLEFLQTPQGALMLLVGGVVGAIIALLFYSVSVFSLPMLVDRDVDFITAIIVSLATVRANLPVLLAWAVLIAAALFLAMLPLFLGLLIALPVFGHATWHLYRRSIGRSGAVA